MNSGVKKTKIDESLETQVVLPQDDSEILTDLDVLAVGNLDFLLPPFKPLSSLGKTNICKEFGLNFVKSITTTYENSNNNIFNLNELVPISTYQVPKDGNCLFSSLSYLITGTIDYYHEMRLLITNNMLSKLAHVCEKFIGSENSH